MLAGLLVFEHIYCSSTGAAAMKEIDIGPEPQLFVDDWIVSSKTGVVRALHPCTKLDKPPVEPEYPWESERIYTYGTVHYYSDRREFGMWYETSFSSLPKGLDPRLHHAPSALTLYAVSKDGIRWTKPGLGLYEFDGSRNNNIVFDLASPSIIVDEKESDPSALTT